MCLVQVTTLRTNVRLPECDEDVECEEEQRERQNGAAEGDERHDAHRRHLVQVELVHFLSDNNITSG